MMIDENAENTSDLLILKSNFVQYRQENILDSYEFYPKELGRGAYGIVYKARDRQISGLWRAVKKIFKKSIKNPNSIKNQIQNLVKLDHPTILKIYEIFEDASNLYLVTDLCQGGELFQKLQKLGSFSQKDARCIFAQVLQAINYCHIQKIAHRDLKPENLLFLNNDSLNLMLVDFGLSFRFENDMRSQLIEKGDTKLVGTSYYIAPQIINGSYDQRCDIWSAGVILYIMVTAIPPFDGGNDKQIIMSVKKGQYTFDVPEMKNVSSQCKDLISRIFMPENERLTIDQIFMHPWMRSNISAIPLQLNFKRFLEFGAYSKLKKITANFIASKFSQQQIERLSVLFKQMDTNNDGSISMQELKQAIASQHQNASFQELRNNDGSISMQELKQAIASQHQNASFQELRGIMDAIDTNKNGLINYTQFVASSIETAKMFTRDNLIRVFKIIDKDGNGVVDRNQLRDVLQKNNYSVINGKQIDDIMEKYDKDHDGKIDLNEFIDAMIE